MTDYAKGDKVEIYGYDVGGPGGVWNGPAIVDDVYGSTIHVTPTEGPMKDRLGGFNRVHVLPLGQIDDNVISDLRAAVFAARDAGYDVEVTASKVITHTL